MKKEIGEAIRSIRLSKGITATYVAKKLGYKSVSSYTRIEKGETDVTLERAKQIADILHCDVNDFFTHGLRETRNTA